MTVIAMKLCMILVREIIGIARLMVNHVNDDPKVVRLLIDYGPLLPFCFLSFRLMII